MKEPTKTVGPVGAILVFQSWGAELPPINAMYEVRTVNGSVVDSGTIIVAWDGRVQIPRPDAGEYTLSIKSWVFLHRKIPFTQGAATVELGPILLLNGDCDGDNVVSLFDYLLLSDAFDSSVGGTSWDARADLDGDGTISLFDYLILSENFDKQGEE